MIVLAGLLTKIVVVNVVVAADGDDNSCGWLKQSGNGGDDNDRQLVRKRKVMKIVPNCDDNSGGDEIQN